MKGLIIFLVLVAWQTFSQDLDDVSDQLALLENEDASEDEYEALTNILTHPINLNRASKEELQFLNILSDDQVNTIVKHRIQFGPFISPLELQTLPGFDLTTIEKLLPHVRVIDPSSMVNHALLTRIRREADSYFLFRLEQGLEQREGARKSTSQDQQFNGIPIKRYFRFRSSRPGDFSFGVTAENDAGEIFTWNNAKRQYGFDYLSIHAQIQNKGKIRNLIIGDYQAQFGQGLIAGGVSAIGKGAETILSPRRINLGFTPYTSAYESGNMRGVGSSLSVSNHITMHAAWSRTSRDGRISDDRISSMQYSGLHRSNAETDTRNTFHEQVITTAVEYRRKSLETGVLVQHLLLNRDFIPEKRIYNRYAFRGNENLNTGFFYNYTLNNLSFFGEVAHTVHQGTAMINGVLMSMTPKLDMAIAHRRYAKNYYSFYSNAFSENTKPQNETATYWGWKYRFNRRWSHNGYVDLFQFPGLKFRTYAPSSGYEWLLRINWQPSRSILVFVQAREESKPKNISENQNTYTLTTARKNNYWITIDYGISQKLRFKTRAQFSTYSFNREHSSGFVLAQDLGFQQNRWKVNARYAVFGTDNWDNRQYMYEQDVWLAFSLPAYDGEGVRKVAVVEYKLNKTFTFWLRYSQTRYLHRKEIGSGADRILGDTRNDIKLQLRIRL